MQSLVYPRQVLYHLAISSSLVEGTQYYSDSEGVTYGNDCKRDATGSQEALGEGGRAS